MSLLLNSAISGLLTAQRGLDTTSHNIANVNTDGYSRQRIVQATRPPEYFGSGYVGTGVNVVDIDRIYDEFLTTQLREAKASEQSLTVFKELATRVNGILSDEAAGLSQGMTEFFETVESLTEDPSSLAVRQAVMGQGQALVDRFQLLDAQMEALDDQVNLRLRGAVDSINGLADSVARLNGRIAATAGPAPNDLLDQRDDLLAQLSEQIDVSTTMQPDGSLNVFVGNGQTLVTGDRSFELGIATDEFDPTRLQVTYGQGGYAISNNLTGGALGGTLEFRRAVLDPARAELGRIATGLAGTFNEVHRSGMDLTGAPGSDFFAMPPVEVLPSANNTGPAGVVLNVADVSALQPRSYELAFAGGGWQLTDLATGAALTMTGSGSPVDPFRFDGLTVEVPPGAVDGDRFQLRPLARAAGGIAMALNSPERIAAASPLGGRVDLANAGDADIATPIVSDPLDPNLNVPVSIVFDDPATFRILDSGGGDLSGPLPYTAGAPISFNGWEVTISGQPAGGDRFDVAPNPAGIGDNSVALRLASVATDGFFGAAGASIRDLESGLLTQVGVTVRQAELSLDAQTAVRHQTEADIQSVSGVSLDEEAINLLQYQEAYMAAAKAITIAESLFQTMLDAVRG